MSVLRLYSDPQTRGARPHWLLEELGIPYELVRLDQATPAQRRRHRRLHPLGLVPALEHGKLRLFESAALCIYIADLDPKRRFLPPPESPARIIVLTWLFFLMTELESPLAVYGFHSSDLPPKERIAAILPWAKRRFEAAAKIVNARLAKSDYLASDEPSIADVVLASMMSWATRRSLVKPYPHIRRHMKKMLERPAAWRVFREFPPS